MARAAGGPPLATERAAPSMASLRAIFSTSNPRGTYLCLEDIGGALAICSIEGTLVGLTPNAWAVLARVGIDPPALPYPLPISLWSELGSTPLGEATEW